VGPGSAEGFAWHTLKEGDELRVGETTIPVGTPPMVERESLTEAVGREAGV